MIVVADKAFNDLARFSKRGRVLDPDGFTFKGLMPALNFPVRLRIIGRCPHMRHAGEANVAFEVFSDELRPVIGDDPRTNAGMVFPSTLDDHLNIGLLHGFSDFPMDDGATAAIEDGAKVVEGAANIDVANVDVPMIVGLIWLNKPGTFFRRSAVPAVESVVGVKYPVDR